MTADAKEPTEPVVLVAGKDGTEAYFLSEVPVPEAEWIAVMSWSQFLAIQRSNGIIP